MSLASQTLDGFTRVGTEFKTLRGTIGLNTNLTTTEKATLVGAINEVRAVAVAASGSGGASINDTTPTTSTTYSSQKSVDLLALKAPLASPAFTGTVTGITKTMVGLSAVDNTSDAAKPVSTATQTALDLKAPLASPAFSGTPTGITKAHVGLANVDNTADSAKPVSSAQQTALDLKAPLASPAFTGTPTGITKTHVGLGNVDNTSDASKPVSTAQAAAIAAKPSINDTTPSASTVYSANKVDTQIASAKASILGSASAAYDTLGELQALFEADDTEAAGFATALGNRLRIDVANQSLTGTQQTNGQTNLNVYSKTEVGSPTTDFVAAFNAALV